MSDESTWRKSSRSGAGGGTNECVELAIATHQTSIRDTKNRDGGTLTLRSAAFAAFLTSVKAGELDR